MSPDENNVIELSESPGRRLRVQRQSRGLDLERIAAQLHLRPAMVEALEQDRYGDLPSPVFVAGYLRNYARLLGMDPTPLIAAYRAAAPALTESALPRTAAVPIRREIGSGHILMRLISFVILAAAIGMLVLWWQNRADSLLDLLPGDGSAALAPAPEGSLPAPADTAPAAPLPAGQLALEPLPPAAPAIAPGGTAPGDLPPLPAVGSAAPAPAELAATPSAQTPSGSGLPAPTPTAAATAAATAGATQEDKPADRAVALSFSGPAWIDVRDSTGKSVLSGEMHKGDRRTLEGKPPYTFVVGNATSTAVTVGGKPFDLKGVTRGNVARFKLDPEGAQ